MAAIKPFRIAVPDASIAALKAKLNAATFPEEFDFSDDWSYGAPLSDVKRLARRWADGFDWRAHEARINDTLPQFTTEVNIDKFGPLNMHFVHKKSSRPGSIPLLFCHGWPGSFLEVEKILPLLTEPEGDGPTFDIVAPSLPNFGFSGRVTKPSFGLPQYAEAVHKVMLALGYNKYVTQGGDWGFTVTRLVGVQYPDHCLASHLNFVYRVDPPSISKGFPIQWLAHAVTPYSQAETDGLERTTWFREEGFGYNLLQSTKPSTIGFALADSPVSLLSWIYEKLHDWTDSYPWTDDEVLEWVSIYQFSTAGPEASVRIYYESRHAEKELTQKGHEWVPGVKIGLSTFPRDILVPPRTWGRTLGPVVFERWHESGGHFAATERPGELAGAVRDMFSKGGGAESVAKVFA